MLFKEIIGQNAVKKHLIQTVNNNRISHALLFLGRTGYGNMALALAYARYICCKNRSAEDACGTCPSCIKLDKLVHPDVHFIFPVNTTKEVDKNPCSSKFLIPWRKAVLENPYMGLYQWLEFIGIENKQGNIKVDESAEILRSNSLKAYEGGYKITIIWKAERMLPATANKLLKIIEEPPEKTLFLLVAENHDQMLPTILSRTQLVKVPGISMNAIKEKLMEEYAMNSDDAAGIAALSDGDWNESLQQLDNLEGENFNRSEFRDWMRLCFGADVPATIKWVDQTSRIGREKQKNFLAYGLFIFREALVQNYGNDELLRVSGPEQEFLRKFAPFVNSANCLDMIETFNTAIQHIERNSNPKMLFLDLSFKMMKLLKVKEEEPV